MEFINLEQVKRVKEPPKEKWIEVIRKDMVVKDLYKNILVDRNEWKIIIPVINPA